VDPGAPIRLFVAAEVSPASREGLAAEIARVARLDPRAKPVAAANLHLTLAFLGATDPARVPAIEAALREVAEASSAPSVVVEGLGAFPDRARPRVIWAGLRDLDAPPRTASLARAVGAALLRIGCPIDEPDRFHAHVTLARLEGRSAPAAPLKMSLEEGTLQRTYGPQVLSDLRLMVSERTGSTTRYRALSAFPLKSP
jgi:RNA 2',3'-cyclic 3'-phosphodiesterase